MPLPLTGEKGNADPMRVLVLARRSELPWYGFSYGSGMERLGVRISYIPEDAPRDLHIEALVAQCPERPSLIYCPDLHRCPIPAGLTEIGIPTVNINEDTYRYTEHRIRWSMLFDYTVLFHPGYEERFRSAGHPRPLFLPLAMNPDVISGPEEERVFEVGTVGQTDSNLYITRRRVLTLLENKFQTNNFRRRYSPKEMAQVYRQSKIVINVPREDYLQEANMRAFEVMGSGALLLAPLPSELSDMGFHEGIHFIGYRGEDELIPLIRRYLEDDPLRVEIARRAQELVWRGHTYESRASALLGQIQRDSGKLFAPARQWPESRIALAYLDHHAGHGFVDSAYGEWKKLARHSPAEAIAGGSLIAKAQARRWRSYWYKVSSSRKSSKDATDSNGKPLAQYSSR